MRNDLKPTPKKYEKIVTLDKQPEYETDEFGSKFPKYEEKEEGEENEKKEEEIPVVHATKVKERTKYTEKHNLIYLTPNDRKRLAILESKNEHGVRLTADEKHELSLIKGRRRKNKTKNERYD